MKETRNVNHNGTGGNALRPERRTADQKQREDKQRRDINTADGAA